MKKIILIAGLIFLTSAKLSPILAADPHLVLSPSSGSYSSAFSVELKVDTGGKASGGVDAYLEYPANLLKVNSVTKGSIFPEVASLIKNDEGKLRINAYFPTSQAGDSFLGSDGLVATINFEPQVSGTAAVNFLCTSGATNDSNIIEKTTITDVIVCSANQNASYSVSPSSDNSSTPTPTAPTPTPPVSGFFGPTLAFGILGLLFSLTGLALIF